MLVCAGFCEMTPSRKGRFPSGMAKSIAALAPSLRDGPGKVENPQRRNFYYRRLFFAITAPKPSSKSVAGSGVQMVSTSIQSRTAGALTESA